MQAWAAQLVLASRPQQQQGRAAATHWRLGLLISWTHWGWGLAKVKQEVSTNRALGKVQPQMQVKPRHMLAAREMGALRRRQQQRGVRLEAAAAAMQVAGHSMVQAIGWGTSRGLLGRGRVSGEMCSPASWRC